MEQEQQEQSRAAAEKSPEMQDLLKKLRDRPFYIWSNDKHRLASDKRNTIKGHCCFNHIIGLPQKNGIAQPLHDYQDMIYKALMVPGFINSMPTIGPTLSHNLEEKRAKERARKVEYYHSFKLKHLWIKKATGLGVTEFMLRFMAWLCLRNDDYKGSQMVIVVGPNWDLAVKLIKRMKALFEPDIYFYTKETVIELNGCSIQAYPSNNLGSFRSLTNPKFILIEEADHFQKSEQEEVRHVAERYIAKSNPFI